MTVLFIDNRDSFVWNLVDYVSQHYDDTRVEPNTITPEDVERINPDAIVLSPGPGHPRDAGNLLKIIKHASAPMLGVCLGHQAICMAYGAKIEHSRVGPVHGKPSQVYHDGSPLFNDVNSPFEAGRYHSLSAPQIKPPLVVAGWSEDGEVMAVRHRTEPVYGLQFHPESVLTPVGLKIIENFLRESGLC